MYSDIHIDCIGNLYVLLANGDKCFITSVGESGTGVLFFPLYELPF